MWDQREALSFIDREPRLLRPLNYPSRHAGPRRRPFRGAAGRKVVGDERHVPASSWTRWTTPSPPSSRRAGQASPGRQRVTPIVLDVHGEATSEKMAMGHVCGRPGQPLRRHPHPCADGGHHGPAPAARPIRPTPACAALRFGHRHGQGPCRFSALPGSCRPSACPSPRARGLSAAVFVETDDPERPGDVRAEPVRRRRPAVAAALCPF